MSEEALFDLFREARIRTAGSAMYLADLIRIGFEGDTKKRAEQWLMEAVDAQEAAYQAWADVAIPSRQARKGQ